METNIQHTQPQGNDTRPTRINFQKAFENQVDFNDLSFASKQTGLPVVMPAFDAYKSAFAEGTDESVIRSNYKGLENQFRLFQSGEYLRGTGGLETGRLPYNNVTREMGYPVMPRPSYEGKGIRNPGTYAYGPGSYYEPERIGTSQQVAESLGVFMKENGEWEKATRINMFNRWIVQEENPDPDSPIPYFWREVNGVDEIFDRSRIRGIMGPERLYSTTAGKILNVRGLLGGILGMTSTAFGGFFGSAGSVFEAIKANDWNYESDGNFITKLGNGFTNAGSYLTHANVDEQVGMFNSWTGFSYGTYQGLGQVFSMGLASKGMAAARYGTKMTTAVSLGLGSAQMGGEIYKQIRLSGGNEMDAALAFYIYSAVTFGTNSIVGANLAQKIGLRKSHQVTKPVIRGVSEAYSKTGKEFSALQPQTKVSASNQMTNGIFGKLRKVRENLDDFLVDYSGRYIQTPLGKFRYGYSIGLAIEETIQETIEEVFQMPLDRLYNKYLAVPRAREVVDGLSGYKYDVHVDENGNRHYFKENNETGYRVPLPWNVWQDEQRSYAMAQNIIAGNYPLEGEFSWEEPFAALITSFIGGQPMFYISGGHKARMHNDKEIYRQKVALEISKLSGKKREEALKEVGERLYREQKYNKTFGSEFITPDGQIITEQSEGAISMVDHAVMTFIDDIKLDLDIIDNYNVNDPEVLKAIRQNVYIQHEALSTLQNVNRIIQGIQKATEAGKTSLDPIPGLIEPNTSIEQAEKQLQGLQENYRYMVQPSDGQGGKQSSQFYKDLMLSEKSFEYMFHGVAEQKAEKYFESKKQIVDDDFRSSKKFAGKVEAFKKEMKNDPKQLLTLGWMLNSKNIKAGNEWMKSKLDKNGRASIPIYMRQLSSFLHDEMQTALGKNLAQVKESDAAFNNLNEIAESFKERMSKIQKLDTGKYKDWSSEFASDFEAIDNDIKEMSEIIEQMSVAQNYNTIEGETAQMLTGLFDEYSSLLSGMIKSGNPILEYQSDFLSGETDFSGVESQGGYMPNPELGSYLMGMQEKITNALKGLDLSKEPNQRPPAKIEELSAQDQSRYRKEAILNIADGTHSFDLKEGETRPSLKTVLDDIYNRINNSESEINDLDSIVNQLDTMEENLMMVLQMINYNHDFLQDFLTKKKLIEFSPLEDGKSNHLKIRKEEALELKSEIETTLSKVVDLRKNEKLTKYSRELGWTKDMIRDLAIRNHLLKNILETDYVKSPEYITAIDNINKIANKVKEGIDHPSFFDLLLEIYVKDTGSKDGNNMAKGSVINILNELHKAVVDAEELLSGKLDKFIRDYKSGKITKGFAYNNLVDYQESIKWDRASTKIEGSLTLHSMISGANKIDNYNHIHYVLTWAVINNRLGQSASEGKPAFSKKNVIQAYRDVLKDKFTQTQKTKEGVEYFVDYYDNVATYEQEQAVVHIVSFLVNSDNKILHEREGLDIAKNIIKTALLLRGYAGTGKTEQVLYDAIKTYNKMTGLSGKKKSMTIIAPTERLLAVHMANERKLVSEQDIKDGTEVFYMTQHEFIESKGSLKTDLYIVDEASLYSSEDINAIRNNIKNKTGIWLGDDSQTPSMEATPEMPYDPADNMILPIHSIAGERTVPLTEIFRSGNGDLFALQDYFRKIFSGQDVGDKPVLKWAIDPETSLIKGGKYYASEAEMRSSFHESYNAIPEKERNASNIIYIVPMHDDIGKTIEAFKNEYGEDFASKVKNHIYSAEYRKGSDSVVSGLSSQMVFFQFDPNDFANRSDMNKTGYDYDVHNRDSMIPTSLLTLVGRIGLTGATRGKIFVGVIDKKTSQSYNKQVTHDQIPYSDILLPSDTKQQRQEAALTRLTMVAGKSEYGNSDNRQENIGTPSDSAHTQTETIERDLLLTKNEKTNIAKTKKFQGIKQLLEEANEAKVISTPYKSATELAAALQLVQEAISKSDPKYKKYQKENRLKTQFYSLVARYSISPAEKRAAIKAKAFEIINDLNAEYKNIYSDDLKQAEKNTIKNGEKYFQTVLNTVHAFVSQDELTIVNPTLLNESIKIIIDGSEQAVGIQSHPAIVRIVGKTSDGKYIVDIEDFNFFRSGVQDIEPGVYTKAKMGMYATLLFQQGYVVNKVKLHQFVASGSIVQTIPSRTLTDDQLNEGIEMIYNQYFKGVSKGFNLPSLATNDQLKENGREIKHDQFKPGYFYSNNKGDIIRVRAVVQTKGGAMLHYSQGREMNIVVKALDQMNAYLPITQSDDYARLYYNSRADNYQRALNDMGFKIQSVHAFNPTISQVGNNISMSDFMNSPEQKTKRSILENFIKNQGSYSLVQKYNPTFNNSKYNHATDSFEGNFEFSHVITLEIDEQSLLDNLEVFKKAFKDNNLHQGLPGSELIQKIKEERYNVLGLLNDPEHKFFEAGNYAVSIKSNQTLSSALDSYINAETDADALPFKETILSAMKEGYKGNNYYNHLLNYNTYKLENLRAVKNAENGIMSVRVINDFTSSGEKVIMPNKQTQPITSLISKLEAKGFELVDVKPASNKSGAFRIMYSFKKEGFQTTVDVMADGKVVNTDYVISLIDELKSDAVTAKMNEYFNAIDEVIENYENIEDAPDSLKLASQRAKEFIESTSAYQFIKANSSVIGRIIEDASIKSGHKLVSKGKYGYEVAGVKAVDKINNLESVLQGIIEIMSDPNSTIEFKADPFFHIDIMDENVVRFKKGDFKPNHTNLVTTVHDVKSPELFVTEDAFIDNENVNDIVEPEYQSVAQMISEETIDIETPVDGKEDVKVDPNSHKDFDGSSIDPNKGEELYSLKNSFVANETNTMSIQSAAQEFSNYVGSLNDKYIKFKNQKVKTLKDAIELGRLMNGIVELTTFNVNGEKRVAQGVVRHEVAHFVMLHMLTPKQEKAVFDSAIKELGDAWDGTARHAYEFIAESFESFSKPQTMWSRFVQKIKEIGNWLGIMKYDYREMMAAIDRGYYRNTAFHVNPNRDIDVLYKRVKNKYADYDLREEVVMKFGGFRVYDMAVKSLVVPVIISNMPGGKSFTGAATNTFGDTIFRTVKKFAKTNIGNDAIGNRKYNINGNDKSVFEMTTSDLAYMSNNRNLDPSYDKGIDDYIGYLLSNRTNIFVILQELFPNKDIPSSYNKARKNISTTDTSSGASTIHAEAENQNAFDKANDLLKLQLRTIPYYTIGTNNTVSRKYGKATAMVPETLVNKVMVDVVKSVVNKHKIDPYEITTRMLIAGLKDYSNSTLPGESKDAAYSIYLEFGLEGKQQDLTRAGKHVYENIAGKPTKVSTLYRDKFGNTPGTGFLYLVNPANAKKLDFQEQYGSKHHWRDKQVHMWSVLSAFRNHYISMHVFPTATVDFESGDVKTKRHMTQSITRNIFKDAVAANLDESGAISNSLAKRFTTSNESSAVIHVDENGFSVNRSYEQDGKKTNKFIPLFSKYDNEITKQGYENPGLIKIVFDALNVHGYKLDDIVRVARLQRKATKSEARNEGDILRMMHVILMAFQANKAMVEAIQKFRTDNAEKIAAYKNNESEPGESNFDAENEVENIGYSLDAENIEAAILNNLSDKDKQILDLVTQEYRNERITNDSFVSIPEFDISFYIPSPVDFYKFYDSFAKDVSDMSSLDGPPSIITPEGKRRYTRSVSSPLAKYSYGSAVMSEKISNKIIEHVQKLDDTAKAEFLRRHPLYDNDLNWLNPILAEMIGFDGAIDFIGVENKYKGANYNKMTNKDLNVAIIEEFFGKEVNRRKSFNRIYVLMSLLSDKSKSVILPSYFMNKDGRTTNPFLYIKKSGNNISDVFVNKDPFVESFDLIIKSYQKRQAIAQEELLSVISKDPAFSEISFDNIEEIQNYIRIDESTAKELEQTLVVGRHYYLTQVETIEGVEYYFSPGNTINLNNVPFSKEFINNWSGTVEQKYAMLKQSISYDFIQWVTDLKKSGALAQLVKSENIPSGFLDTFGKINLDTLVSDLDLDDPSAVKSDYSESYGEAIAELKKEINEMRNQWLLLNQYKEDGSKKPLGETLTVEALSFLDESIRNDIYKAMAEDIEFSKSINDLKNNTKKEIKKITNKDVIKVIKEENAKWPPALEALYMSYWLVNESVSQLERQDPTSFKNPNDFVKRGASLNAPGTGYDLSNPHGIGKSIKVAVFNDIPGFNEFLNVKPGDKAGAELNTNGVAFVNPVVNVLLKRSSGMDYGLHGDHSNKTVASGHDHLNNRSFYLKHSQRAISEFEYRHSEFLQSMFRGMLGKHFGVFNFIYDSVRDWNKTMEYMADYAVSPMRFLSIAQSISGLAENISLLEELVQSTVTYDDLQGGTIVSPRDEITGFVQHLSTYKHGANSINTYDFPPGFKNLQGVKYPEQVQTIDMPSEFLRLQVVNNSDGSSDVHSFATQLFSLIGVQEWNAQYASDFNDSLAYSADKFTKELENVIFEAKEEDASEHEQNELNNKAILKYVKRTVLRNAGGSIKGTKIYDLLVNNDTVGDVFGPKLFESIISYLNDYLKPSVPGANMVQNPSFVNIIDINGKPILSREGSKGTRSLKPLTYYTKNGVEFKNREEFQKFIESNPDDVFVSPAEVIMKFHYADKFNLPYDISLQEVMTFVVNGVEHSLYETGLERSMGNGARTFDDVVAKLVSFGIKSNKDLINSIKSPHMKQMFMTFLKNQARKNIRNDQTNVYEQYKNLSDKFEREKFLDRITNEYLEQDKIIETVEVKGKKVTIPYALATIVAEYYYDLNNALDVMTVRIPTTNASSASAGRIIEFADIGNTILTSPEKSILDGSDYDYDELHTFYPELAGRKRVYDYTTEKGNTNRMFDAMYGFFLNAKNHGMVLSPIDLTSFRESVVNQDNASFANTLNHNSKAHEANMAGRNLVGHFSNQLVFTTKLISMPFDKLKKMVHPDLRMVLSSNEYENTIDFISKLVNAAVDNPNENGLLGNLGINEGVTSLIAGMVLHNVTDASGDVQAKIFKMLKDRTLVSAANEVIASHSVSNLGKKSKLYEVLESRYEKAGSERQKNKLLKLLDYVYTGEALVRLGSFYKLTQGLSGTKAEYARDMYNLRKALGYYDIQSFINSVENGTLLSSDYTKDAERRLFAEMNYDQSKSMFGAKESIDPALKAREIRIREMINIPGIVSSSKLMMSQLKAIAQLDNYMENLDTSNKLITFRNSFLEATKQPELLFEEGYNSYEQSIKRAMIGFHMMNHGETVSLPILDPTTDNITTMNLDMKNVKDQMMFIAMFPDFIKGLRSKMAGLNIGTEFLNRIEIEKYGSSVIPIANFRNSIYYDDAQKIYFIQEYRKLVKVAQGLGIDVRTIFNNYQALVYGFAYRNGSFADIINSDFEVNYSKNYENNLSVFQDYILKDPAKAIEELSVYMPDALPGKAAGGSFEKSIKPSIYKILNDNAKVTSFMTSPRHAGNTEQTNHMGDILVMPVFPKEFFVFAPGMSSTYKFTYPSLSKTDLLELRNNKSITIKRLNHTGVHENKLLKADDPNARENQTGEKVDQTKFLRNRPYHGSYIVTALGDVAKVRWVSNYEFNLELVSGIKQQKVSSANSAVAAHSLDMITRMFEKSFKGIDHIYVDDTTSLTSGIAYNHNGILYINRDKVSADTHFHEIAHVLIPIIKEMMPSLYSALKRDAQNMIDDNDPIVMEIIKEYPELSGNDLIEEVISQTVGFVNSGKLVDFLEGKNVKNAEATGKSFWSRYKSRINSFWNSIKNIFNRSGINISSESTTIKDFAGDLFNKVMAGEVILDMSNSKLKSLALANTGLLKEQRISTAMDFYDAIMNTGTIVVGDNVEAIKQIRHLDQKEKINNIKDQIRNQNYVYQTTDGEILRFDPNKQNEWDVEIVDKILKDIDIKSEALKKELIKVLNERDGNYVALQKALGKNKFDNYKYSIKAVRKIFSAISYTKAAKYYQYSNLPQKYAFLYNKELEGFDPIVAIEYDSEDRIMASFFNITNDFIISRDDLADRNNTNLLGAYYDDATARRLKFDMHANVGNSSNVIMALIASNLSNYKKEVMVRDISTIGVNPTNTFVMRADMVRMKKAMGGMKNAPKFFENLSPELQRAVENFTNVSSGFDYTRMLFDMFKHDAYYNKYLSEIERGAMPARTLKKVLAYRLNQMRLVDDSHDGVDYSLENEMLVRTISALNNEVIISDEMNTESDVKAFEKFISPSYDVNHTAIDLVRRITIDANQRNVAKQVKFKKKIDSFAQFFYDRNTAFRYVTDKNWGNFKEILATVKDQNGVDRYAGSVLWTTDQNLDPVFYEQAKNVDPESLKKAAEYVEFVTDIMIDSMMHRNYMNHGGRTIKNGIEVNYTREMAEEDLFSLTTYKKGMIPLMHDTINMLMGRGKVFNALKKKWNHAQTSFTDFEELMQLNRNEQDLIDKLPDMFTDQFGYRISGEPIGKLGLKNSRMYNMLGLVEKDGQFIYNENNSKMQDVNVDLENTLEFFHMSVNRKITYEQDVLPVINGVKMYLIDLTNNKDFAQQNVIEYIDSFTRQAIQNRMQKDTLQALDLNIEPIVKATSAIASPLVMALNINVGVVSAIHNGMMSFIEGATNSLLNSLTNEEKSHWATTSDYLKASGAAFTEFHKVSQLLRDNQLMNPNEYELIMHRFHNFKRRKHVFSDFYAQIFNWGADYYARGVVMAAQMMRDGSWDAYTYNSETGKVEYDIKKDRRYYNSDGTQTKEQEILYKALQDRLYEDGIMDAADQEPEIGYSFKEMRTFKTLADKYIVGAYGPIERNMLGQVMVGRLAGMFTTWFMSKLSNAYKRGGYIDELGYYKVVMDVHGNYVPQWQREWTEGYMNTVWSMTLSLMKGDTARFSDMKGYEKKNLIRFSMNVLTFLAAWFAYGLFVEDPKRRERLEKLRSTDPLMYNENMKFWNKTRKMLSLDPHGTVDETRLLRNWRYSYSSIFMAPVILEKLDSPFAVVGIVRRSLTQGLGLLGGDWSKLNHVMPGVGGYYTVREQIQALKD